MSLTSRIECDKEIDDILDMFNYDDMLNQINSYDYKTDLKVSRKLSNKYLNYDNKAIINLKQIVGYYLLNYLNKGNTINNLCLYYARYGVFIEKKLTTSEKTILSKDILS